MLYAYCTAAQSLPFRMAVIPSSMGNIQIPMSRAEFRFDKSNDACIAEGFHYENISASFGSQSQPPALPGDKRKPMARGRVDKKKSPS